MYNIKDKRVKQNYIKLIDAIKKIDYKNLIVNEKINFKKYNTTVRKLKEFIKKILHYRNDNFVDALGNNNLDTINVNYFSSHKIAVYTCITGDYDNLNDPLFCPDNCDFYVITNLSVPKNSKWQRINPNLYIKNHNLTNIEINRYFKMFPQILFPEYKYSVYVDGNIELATDVTEFVNRISDKGMAFFKHAQRKSVYREAEACVAWGKAKKEDVDNWVQFLKKKKMPEDYGLVQCSVIARDHSSQIMRKVMKEWWNLFYEGKVKRDQLLLPYVLMKNNISVDDVCTLGGNVWTYPGLQTIAHN